MCPVYIHTCGVARLSACVCVAPGRVFARAHIYICIHIYAYMCTHRYTHMHIYAPRKWINRRVRVDAPAVAYARRRAQALAHTCSVHTTICGLAMRVCMHSLTRRLCAMTKVSRHGFKLRAFACNPIAVWLRYHGYRHA
jgi:hypothetical protein